MKPQLSRVSRSDNMILALSSRLSNGANVSQNLLPFKVFRDVSPLRQYRKQLLLSNRSVGLVPTMGALHEGHLSLIRQAASENTDVVVSIYVNPTQFGVNEDLAAYPRTWASDIQKLGNLDKELAGAESRIDGSGNLGSSLGRITAVFAPTTEVMYPTLPPTSEINGHGSFVTITPLATMLEGTSRPVFFRGVATVCMKLFNMVSADRVYFGQKDVQQTVVIKRMVKDFHIDTEVKIGPTIREKDGLAMSSRNVFLGARRRNVALVLSKALHEAEGAFLSGKRSRKEILGAAYRLADSVLEQQISLPSSERAQFQVDYISLADPESLDEVDIVEDSKGAILSGAVKMAPIEDPGPDEDGGVGSGTMPVRLIDNIILKPVV